MAQRKYVSYSTMCNRLSKFVSKYGYSKPGVLVRLLLDTFIENQGKLPASRVYDLELCKDFSKWRKDLCSEGWLDFTIDANKFVTYKPGKNLIPYINKEKFNGSEIATRNDIFAETDPIKAELEKKADKSELEELRNAMTRVLNIIDPPDSPQKRKKFVQGEYDSHLQLIRQNSSEI